MEYQRIRGQGGRQQCVGQEQRSGGRGVRLG